MNTKRLLRSAILVILLAMIAAATLYLLKDSLCPDGSMSTTEVVQTAESVEQQ